MSRNARCRRSGRSARSRTRRRCADRDCCGECRSTAARCPTRAAAGTSPQTLKSRRRSLNGEVANRTSSSRRASALELAALGRRVAVAEDQQVHLVGGSPLRSNLDQRAGRWVGQRSVDEHVFGIDRGRPDLAESVAAVALRVTVTGAAAPGTAPTRGTCASRSWPRRSSPTRRRSRRSRANRAAVRRRVPDLEAVLAELRLVERPARGGPATRGSTTAVEARRAPALRCRCGIVDAHSAQPWRRGHLGRHGGDGQQRNQQRAHRTSSKRVWPTKS